MFTNKFMKTLGSVFSSILLMVTFGVFSVSTADAKAPSSTTTSPAVPADRELLESLKGRISADYRVNIDAFESSNFPG